jgi:hypothetical protein
MANTNSLIKSLLDNKWESTDNDLLMELIGKICIYEIESVESKEINTKDISRYRLNPKSQVKENATNFFAEKLLDTEWEEMNYELFNKIVDKVNEQIDKICVAAHLKESQIR